MKSLHVPAFLILVLFASSFPAPRAESEIMPGGITETSVKDKWVTQATDFAIKAKEREIREKKKEPPVKLAIVEILSARRQVVAGMNFYIRLKVKMDETEREAEVIIWRQLSGVHKLTSWEWK